MKPIISGTGGTQPILAQSTDKKQKQIYSTAQSVVAMYYYIHFLTQITLKKKKLKKQKTHEKLTKKSHIPTTHTIFPFHEAFTFISQVLVSQR